MVPNPEGEALILSLRHPNWFPQKFTSGTGRFPSQIQGAIMASSVFQIVIGFSGVIGFLMRYIGPITVAPTVTLIGIALFHVAAEHAGIPSRTFIRSV